MSNPASPNSIQLYIGIDGGGTSCRARIEDTEGNVLGQGTSDEGSDADLGLQAVRLALCAQDGRISPAPFLLEVIGKFGSNPVALVAEQATATEYASLAPVALAYAEAGDPFAEEIVAEGAGRLMGSFVPWWNSVRSPSLCLGVWHRAWFSGFHLRSCTFCPHPRLMQWPGPCFWPGAKDRSQSLPAGRGKVRRYAD